MGWLDGLFFKQNMFFLGEKKQGGQTTGRGVKTRLKHGESCWKASDVCALGNGSLLWQLPLCRLWAV